MDERRHNKRHDHPRCLACGGSGYGAFPKATDSRVEVLLGETGMAVTRTVYEGPVYVSQGHFVRIDSRHVPVTKVEGQWIAAWPDDKAVRPRAGSSTPYVVQKD